MILDSQKVGKQKLKSYFEKTGPNVLINVTVIKCFIFILLI